MAAIDFPNPATQNPLNTFSPTSTPSSTSNGYTYIFENGKWVSSGEGNSNPIFDSVNTNSLAGFRNLLINGSMTFWQRATSGTGTGFQGPDRWRSASDSPVVTRRTIAPGTGQAGVPATYSCEISTSGSAAGITQCIELPYGGGRQDGFDVGNQYTLSWYGDTTNPAEFDVYTPAFVDDSTGALNTVTAGTKGDIELIETMGSTGWGRFQSLITITGNVGQTNIALSVGVATLGNTHQVTSIQFEPGPVATPFELRPIGTELALCQRYLYVLGSNNNGVYFPVNGFVKTSTQACVTVNYPVTMRIPDPTLTFRAAETNFTIWLKESTRTVTSITASDRTENGGVYNINTGGGMDPGDCVQFGTGPDAGGNSLIISAEI